MAHGARVGCGPCTPDRLSQPLPGGRRSLQAGSRERRPVRRPAARRSLSVALGDVRSGFGAYRWVGRAGRPSPTLGGVRTTIMIDAALWQEAKQLAVRSGRSLSAVIEGAWRATLTRQRAAGPRKPFGFVPVAGHGLRPGVDLDDSAGLLDLLMRRPMILIDVNGLVSAIAWMPRSRWPLGGGWRLGGALGWPSRAGGARPAAPARFTPALALRACFPAG